MTPRKQLIDALKVRLEGISIANGFNTDAGQWVEVGTPSCSEEDVYPFINIVIEDDEYTKHANTPKEVQVYACTLPISIEATFRNRDQDPTELLELALHDIKRCVLSNTDLPCRNYELKSSSTFMRNEGGQFVAVAVRFEFYFVENYC